MILVLLYILIFISGLFIGSFLNVVSDRVLNKKSILWGRSVCDFCNRTLTVFELVPVVSFFLQKGVCKGCKTKLSWNYPISEVLTGVVFVLIAERLNVFEVGSNYYVWAFFFYLLIISGFYIILFLTDVKYRLLPNKVVYPAIIFVSSFLVVSFLAYLYILYSQLSNDDFGKYLIKAGYWELQKMEMMKNLLYTFVSALGIGVFFWLLTLIKGGRAMGGGDVKLAFLIGLVNGFPENLIAIFLGFLSGAVVSLLLVLFGRKTIKDTVPFGPFLIFGSFVALFWGSDLLNWYLNLF